MIKFSIIIPVKSINDYVRETVPYIQNLSGPEWELFIIPNNDEPNEWVSDHRIRITPSGRVGPADKRDMGAKVASGDVLVFLDDDSYPDKNLLGIARDRFADPDVVALGGPAMTPPDDSFWQKVSGAVFLSKFSGGAPERYVPVGDARFVSDWPSVNFMVRKEAFLAVGGFDSPYWPGEDTKLCLDLINKTRQKILYVPEMIVWHHRRAGLLAHLKQVGGYGIHRGYFAKKYPQTSRLPLYFVPSMFVIFILVTLLGLMFSTGLSWLLVVGWVVYALALTKALFDMRRYEAIDVAIAALPYVFLTHFWYGVRFIQGYLAPKLVSRLR